MNPNIIAFSGRLRSGKSELASICEKFGYERLYFAKPLKMLIASLIKGTIDDVNNLKNGNTETNWSKTINEDDCDFISKEANIPLENVKNILLNHVFNNTRDMLQIIGTDLIRSYNSNWHVDRTKAMIEEGKKYVIDDVRFTNEKKCLEDLNAIIWFVVRPKFDDISHHISEETLKWQDFNSHIIVNNQSLNYLKMIWEIFMNSGYEKSASLRNKELIQLRTDKNLRDKYLNDEEFFNTFNFLLIPKDLFTYSGLYKNSTDIAKVTEYKDKLLYVNWKDKELDGDIVDNSLDIEDLKIYL